jgi:hypothetical protein
MARFHATANGNVPFTPEEEAEWDAEEAAWAAGENGRLAAAAREKRNALLAECDWTQVADAPVDNLAWAIYRQALRDISEQPGFPSTIVWPAAPDGKLPNG